MVCLRILFLSFGLFTAQFINSAQALEGEKINGGDTTEHSKFPYQVRIVGKKGRLLSFCGGSILDDYHVISAAHCFVNYQEVPYTWYENAYNVIAGATNLKTDDPAKWVRVNVQKVYVPASNFENSHDGDIAILKLETSLNLKKNSHLKAVSLPSDDEFIMAKAVVSGYGWNEVWYEENEDGERMEVGASDGKLRFANARVLANYGCQDHYIRTIKSSLVCAQVYQRDFRHPEGVCSGDSGGPLVYNGNIQIGVVNTSPLLCKEDERPGVYARVSAYKDFIRKAVSDTNDSEIRTNVLRIGTVEEFATTR